jgi:uncharacterized protein (TIGR03118 family)
MKKRFRGSGCAFFAPPILMATIFVLGSSATLQGQSVYQVTNLVSDIANPPGGAPQIVDPDLVNPWGMSFSAASPFWIANQGTGTSTLYSGDTVNPNGTRNPLTKSPLTVVISGPPTGTVFSGSNDFVLPNGQPARFLFAALDGTISGWNSGTTAVTVAQTTGGIYTGLALISNDVGNFLAAANVAQGNIDVFDGNFNPVTLPGGFIDPDLPGGFTPFNIQNLGGELYVAYQNSLDPEHDGVVDVFDGQGNFSRRIASGDPLNAPWGLALAPANFGAFSKALLVGNFGLGDGRINAFDPQSGDFLGQLSDIDGNPIVLERIWALAVGNDGSAGSSRDIYFAAGINDQQDGLFGRISFTP